MYETLGVHLVGLRPALQHNGRLKNPLDPWAKELRKYSSKKKKVDEDHIAMMECEFKGSLYLLRDSQTKLEDAGKTVIWPGENVEAMIRSGAKMRKLGKKTIAGIIVRDSYPLLYEGPGTRCGLWRDTTFHFVKGTNRGVMSCRPIFHQWEFVFDLCFFPDVINEDDVKRSIKDAGRFVGLTEWYGKFGLFEVRKFQNGGFFNGKEGTQQEAPESRTVARKAITGRGRRKNVKGRK